MALRPQHPLAVLLPAQNVAHVLDIALDSLPPDLDADLILVDDCSFDGTARKAHERGLHCVVHAAPLGPGAVLKTLFHEAMKHDYEHLAVFTPNGMYTGQDLPALLAPLRAGEADAVLGSELLGPDPRDMNMPAAAYYAQRLSALYWNAALGTKLSSYHHPLRAYRADVLRRLPLRLNSRHNIFNVEMLAQLTATHARISELPITLRGYATIPGPMSFRALRTIWNATSFTLKNTLHTTGLKRTDQLTPTTPT